LAVTRIRYDRRVKLLPARLCPRPRILFVGINPSLRSAAVGHHFAGPGNPFWRLLHAAKLIDEPLTYEDDVTLPARGLALTNICARPTRAASELTAAEFVTGRARLARLIARVRPEIVAFVGVTVYRAFFGPGVSPGAGPKPERIGTARVFVVPNPSGLNAAYPGFEDKLVWFRRLRRFSDALTAPRSAAPPPRRDPPRWGAR
jgi:TDG/mug DNA glycosylase family protein